MFRRFRVGGPLVLAIIAVVQLLLTGCSSSSTDPEAGPTTPASSSSSSSSSPAGSVAATSAGPSPAALPDGRHFAYIRSFDVPARVVTVDEVQFLSGDEANAAAREDGQADPDCADPQGRPGVCNDYYIRNIDRRTVEVRIPADAAITTNVLSGETSGDSSKDVPVTLERLAGLFAERPAVAELSPFIITVSGGRVASLREMFLP